MTATATNIETAKAQASAAVDVAAGELVRIAREIHARPELAYQETFACGQLASFARAQGFAVTDAAHGIETAFRAESGDGPVTIALCAEYDALPGIGHACGHNLMGTAAAGAAAGVRAALAPADARIVLLGTPAEEKEGGKIRLLSAGAFQGVDVAMMAHAGSVDIADAPMFGVAHVDVEYRGKAVHASVFPEQGVNALDALVTAYQAVAQLRQHIRRDARIHGIITHGGDAANIVPGRAAGTFYVRALKPWYLEQLKERVRHCFEAGALATGCELSMDWHEDAEYAPMKTNRPLAQAYRENAEKLGRNFIELRELTSGSSDMGNVSQAVPSIHPLFGVGTMALTHSPEFTAAAGTDAAFEAMLVVAKALAHTAIDVALDADLRERIRADFGASGRR